MKNKYIIKGNKLVRDDLESVMLYFDYFCPGIILPVFIDFWTIRIITHKVLRFLVYIAYLSKLYTILYGNSLLEESASLIINGTGQWKNTIKLIKVNGKLVVRKFCSNHKAYVREKKYFELYKNKSKKIAFPSYKFLTNDTIEYDYIPQNTFQRQILSGELSYKEIITHVFEIKKELKKIYGNNPTLVHGDLWPINIFLYNNSYYFIDFSDSREDSYHFDLYALLYSILYFQKFITENEYSISGIKYNNRNISAILEVSDYQLGEIEERFRESRNIKCPDIYYSSKRVLLPKQSKKYIFNQI